MEEPNPIETSTMEEPNPIETSTIREREMEVVEPRSQVEITMETELDELADMLLRCCIYRVPEVLRTLNRDAYTPRVISIGPYHYKTKNLQNMHFYKIKFVQNFIQRTKVKLGVCVKMAQDMEGEVRKHYDEGIALDSDEFVRMILTDSIFLVEFILQYHDAPIPENFMDKSLTDDIIHDLMLLENQLPSFVLTSLFDVYASHDFSWITCSSMFLIRHFEISQISQKPNRVIHKYVDWPTVSCKIDVLHLVDFQHTLCILSSSLQLASKNFKGKEIELLRSATELQEAGVKIDTHNLWNLTDVSFTSGVLQITPIVLQRNTESLFRNLIAYEQCHRKGNIFRSYIIFMDCLINTSKDVDLLVELGIIRNSLGDSEDVCTLFNNLYKIIMMEGSDFYYADLCRKLNNYSKNWWHQWKATWFRAKKVLRHDYFDSPWTIISVFAAFTLLVLTVIQAICSIKGTKW